MLWTLPPSKQQDRLTVARPDDAAISEQQLSQDAAESRSKKHDSQATTIDVDQCRYVAGLGREIKSLMLNPFRLTTISLCWVM